MAYWGGQAQGGVVIPQCGFIVARLVPGAAPFSQREGGGRVQYERRVEIRDGRIQCAGFHIGPAPHRPQAGPACIRERGIGKGDTAFPNVEPETAGARETVSGTVLKLCRRRRGKNG